LQLKQHHSHTHSSIYMYSYGLLPKSLLREPSVYNSLLYGVITYPLEGSLARIFTGNESLETWWQMFLVSYHAQFKRTHIMHMPGLTYFNQHLIYTSLTTSVWQKWPCYCTTNKVESKLYIEMCLVVNLIMEVIYNYYILWAQSLVCLW